MPPSSINWATSMRRKSERSLLGAIANQRSFVRRGSLLRA
jgi:hypothetical protein